MHILAHRALLSGPDKSTENALWSTRRAEALAFGVEFDVQLDCEARRLVLSHDLAPWSEDRDAACFLASPAEGAIHALNVKSLYTLPAITSILNQSNTADRFFLFDFELVSDDLPACRYLMRSLSDQGFRIAYRLSEREPHLEPYLADPAVEWLWLDEFEMPWLTEQHVRRMADAGKRSYYVSRDLHGCRDMRSIERRWAEMAAWGVAGICTDYPLRLRELLGELS